MLPGLGLQLFPGLGDSARPFRVSAFASSGAKDAGLDATMSTGPGGPRAFCIDETGAK
jgi:hypothetical protein